MAPDLGIFAYALAVSLVAGILFGVVPAVESSRSALASSARSSTTSGRSRYIQDVLVCAQVALSSVLLIAGSLLVRSAMRSLSTDPGYDTGHVIALTFQFTKAAKYTTGRKETVAHELRARLAACRRDGRRRCAATGDNRFRTPAVSLDGESSAVRNQRTMVHYSYVQANYFARWAFRSFSVAVPAQAGQTERSVILSQSAAAQLWPARTHRPHRASRLTEKLHNTANCSPTAMPGHRRRA